ncbi:MAG: EAL domain-containing protein [Anaerolineae bacterium]|nr:EAL domain-containing protein [Anaerolineae bacterium]
MNGVNSLTHNSILPQYRNALNESQLRCLARNVSDSIIVLDIQSRKIIYVNHDSFLGFELNEMINIPLFIESGIHPEDREIFETYTQKLQLRQKNIVNLRFKNKKGQWEWIHCEGLLIDSGNVHHAPFEAHVISIQTNQRKIELLENDRAHALEMIARDWPVEAIFNHLVKSIGLQIEDSLPQILINNGSGLRHSAASPLLSENFTQIVDTFLQNGAYGLWNTAISEKKALWCHDVFEDASWGDFQSLLMRENVHSVFIMPINSADGTSLGAIVLYFKKNREEEKRIGEVCESYANICALVVERRRFTDMLYHQAMYDSLTNLPNRNLLEDNLHQAIFHARRKNQIIGLAFFSLDNFDTIKETLGYYIGEELLKLVAERLLHFTGDANEIAHPKENTFAIILCNLIDRSHALEMIQQIMALLRPSFRAGNNDLYLEISTGFSVFPRDGEDVVEIIKNAEMALAFPRMSGSENIVGYEAEMNVIAHERLRITNQLRSAAEQGQFTLFYQPQVDIENRRVVGFEGLIRWKHAEFGFVPPLTFIPLAEDTGLIVPIGDWVLNEACRQLSEWQHLQYPEMRVAINVSPVQFMHGDFFGRLNKAINKFQVSPNQLAIEITENVFMRDTEEVAKKLKKIRDVGIEVHIDDFGTAYSSLSYLRKLPLDCLKIDKSFIDAMSERTQEEIDTIALTRSIVTLGHGLKLSVMAEGVESSQQVNLLADMGCDQAQGYLFSRPLPADEVWPAVENINHFWKAIGS